MHAPEPTSGFPLTERLSWLRRFRALVAGDAEALCRLIRKDMGKPEREAIVQDVVPLLSACTWHLRHAPRLLAERSLGWGGIWTIGQRHRVLRAPLGHVAIIATWNYPVQLLGVQLVQALLAGNRVTVKPSESALLSQNRLLDFALEAAPPGGYLNRTEATREAGPAMLRSRRFDHVVFTGSTGVGRSIAEWAAGTLTPTTLELSGRDSALVLDDADPELAARSIWAGVVMNAGQTCMAPRRALVDRGVYADFVAHLAARAAAAKPLELVSPESATRLDDLLSRSLPRSGGRGPRLLSGVRERASGRRFTPVALLDCRGDEPLAAGDHFGPALAVVPCDGLDHMLRVHDACPQRLATSVYTSNPRRASDLAPRLGSGIVTINDTILPTGHPASSISGIGESGWGDSRGAAGLLALSREVRVSVTSPLVRPPVDPMTPTVASTITRFAQRLYGAVRSRSPAQPPAEPRGPSPAHTPDSHLNTHSNASPAPRVEA